jgi:hypothetical protein
MTRLYFLTAVGILGPLAFAASIAWLMNRPPRLRCWLAGHRWREVEQWGIVALYRCDRCSAEQMRADQPPS